MSAPTETTGAALCGRGTFHGPAAEASQYGFARCILPFDHPNIGAGCDSGPVVADETPEQQAA